ncbi:MAG: hypothetical protein IPM24_11755 [Bryobacterales bacterium]|nr:hypothetical protein [Bryobacterales bacterium]
MRQAAPPPPPPPPVAQPAPAAQQPKTTYVLPPPQRGMPVWLATILSAAVFAGLFAAVYYGIQYFKEDRPAAAKPAIAFEDVPEGAKPNRMLRFLSVSGLRLLQNAQRKTEVRFVVVNHSTAQTSPIGAKARILARTNGGPDTDLGMVEFKLPALGPYETKDISAVLETKLRAYELPDWQFLKAELILPPEAP